MADTGAPWNLPYPESTDLVRDGAQAIEDLAEDVAGALTKAYTGIGTNVVQAVKTDSFTMTSSTFTTVTGLSATITPSATSSKVLIIAQIAHGFNNANAYGLFQVTRGSTEIYRGDDESSRPRAVFGGDSQVNTNTHLISSSIVYLDSPGVDTATTYNVQVRRRGTDGAVFVNRNALFDAPSVVGASSITVIEVAA